MNKSIVILIAILGILGTTLAVGAIYCISVYNTAGTLKNQYEAKLKANTASFDNMFKTIDQSAQVTNKQKEALRDIFTSYASARTTGGSQDGSLMKWVTESIPNVDVSVYKSLMNVITSSRESWTMRQLELVDIARQFNEPFNRIPTNFLLPAFGYQRIDAKVVTSDRTEQAFATGRDNETKLP